VHRESRNRDRRLYRFCEGALAGSQQEGEAEYWEPYAVVSVIPYPLIIGHIAMEINSWVSLAIGAAPFRHNRNLPPVASLTLLKTKVSNTVDPGRPLFTRSLTS
jgi:hypothetical protein